MSIHVCILDICEQHTRSNLEVHILNVDSFWRVIMKHPRTYIFVTGAETGAVCVHWPSML